MHEAKQKMLGGKCTNHQYRQTVYRDIEREYGI